MNLNATLTTSLTLSAAPGNVNFTLVPNGIANGSATVGIKTNWTLQTLISTVTVWAYFSNATSALSDGAGDNIPSSSVLGSPNGGAFTAFTTTSPFGVGSSLQVSRFAVLGLGFAGTRTDTLNLQINTTGLNLPAATYTGVLHIQAQAL